MARSQRRDGQFRPKSNPVSRQDTKISVNRSGITLNTRRWRKRRTSYAYEISTWVSTRHVMGSAESPLTYSPDTTHPGSGIGSASAALALLIRSIGDETAVGEVDQGSSPA